MSDNVNYALKGIMKFAHLNRSRHDDLEKATGVRAGELADAIEQLQDKEGELEDLVGGHDVDGISSKVDDNECLIEDLKDQLNTYDLELNGSSVREVEQSLESTDIAVEDLKNSLCDTDSAVEDLESSLAIAVEDFEKALACVDTGELGSTLDAVSDRLLGVEDRVGSLEDSLDGEIVSIKDLATRFNRLEHRVSDSSLDSLTDKYDAVDDKAHESLRIINQVQDEVVILHNCHTTLEGRLNRLEQGGVAKQPGVEANDDFLVDAIQCLFGVHGVDIDFNITISVKDGE